MVERRRVNFTQTFADIFSLCCCCCKLAYVVDLLVWGMVQSNKGEMVEVENHHNTNCILMWGRSFCTHFRYIRHLPSYMKSNVCMYVTESYRCREKKKRSSKTDTSHRYCKLKILKFKCQHQINKTLPRFVETKRQSYLFNTHKMCQHSPISITISFFTKDWTT